MRRKFVFGFTAAIVGLLAGLVGAPMSLASQSNSTHYSVDEVFFGNGGQLNACSTNYCSKQAAGEMTVGPSSSTNYKIQAGFNTDRAPSLSLIIPTQSIDLGVLSVSSPTTTTASFSVKSYLSSGYIVQTASDPPTGLSGTHPLLHNLTSPTASSPGTEQFGINLVANTSPVSFGATPQQAPDSSFGFGTAASGYNTANLFKYVKGDTIAQSLKSSGETDYTISYLFNISNTTIANKYQFQHVLVATATF